jgi:dynein heavy chain 1
MNPGYLGRSDLPENLVSLFRGVSMTSPDKLLIAQVMLFSQGFAHAEVLASKIITFFDICGEQVSSQLHYDFGLRALKSVLISAGRLQRLFLNENFDQNAVSYLKTEECVMVQSIKEAVFPKLVDFDVLTAERFNLHN